MTLYTISGFAMGVREDAFAFAQGRERYLFSGVTLDGDSYVPNSIERGAYYALTENMGIEVSGFRANLVENGDTKLTTGDLWERWSYKQHRPFFAKTIEEITTNPPLEWSKWSEIKTELREIARSNERAQQIFSIMTEWEELSFQTLRHVARTMKHKAKPSDIVEIYVASQQWLWHNCTQGKIIIGYGKQIWGEVFLSPPKTIITCGALPVSDGWFVGLTHHNRYLLRREGRGIIARPAMFPRWEWQQKGEWVYWLHDAVLLTPTNRLMAIPQDFTLQQASQELALLKKPFDAAVLVNKLGELHTIDTSGYIRSPDFLLGNRSVLVDSVPNKEFCFFVIDVGQQLSLYYEQAVGVPFRTIASFSCADNETDIYVLAITPIKPSGCWCFCLVDTQGRFWQPPIVLRGSPSYQMHFPRDAGPGKVVIKLSGASHDLLSDAITFEAIDKQVVMGLGPGISVSGQMTPLPRETSSLWDCLRTLFEKHS